MAALALVIAYWLRFDVFPFFIRPGERNPFTPYLEAAPVLAGCLLVVFALMGVYTNGRGVIFVDELFDALRAIGLSGVVVLAAMFFYAPERSAYSRGTFIFWLCAASLMIGCARFAIRKIERGQRARGIGAVRCLVMGSGDAAAQLIQRIKMFPDFGYQLVGVLTRDPSGASFSGAEVARSATEMADMIERENVDVVFVALPHLEQDRIMDLIAANRREGVEFRVVPTTLELIASHVEPDQLAGIPLLRLRPGLELAPPQMASKRVFDIVLSSIALLTLSPLIAIVAVLIKATSRGPILIRQERVGMDNHPFQMLKFRSMQADAEATTGPVWAAARDDRRTTVGRWLRRFSLDELPQLWNVLKGEMSLVGPRPERPVFVVDFGTRIPTYGKRHRVRPGLTGWAQVNDLRGMTSVEERLVYDLYYIERWTLAFDLKIVMTTAFRVFISKNAS